MKNLLASLAIGAVLAWASAAAADAMPACPEGQHVEHNPTSPGAQHHAGGRCVENESSGCATAGSAGGVGAGVLLIGLIAWRRRRAAS